LEALIQDVASVAEEPTQSLFLAQWQLLLRQIARGRSVQTRRKPISDFSFAMHLTAPPSTPAPGSSPSREWHLFVPKLVVALREGYSWKHFRADAVSGLTVAIVALPLSMALAIASGVPPERGLFTAIVAGFFVSALGGVRHQIGGPAGAFVVVVFDIVAKHGYSGLVVATLMAGLILIVAGLARLGTYIKYIPYPVITGFTTGIALIIFTSQIGEILGLRLSEVPSDFIAKVSLFIQSIDKVDPTTMAVALGSLVVILALRRFAPSLPGFLIAIVLSSLLVFALSLNVETIGTRFGGIPSMLPAPAWPEITFARIQEMMPGALTIAFLAGIESLLCAVVADGMTGRRHRSNMELVAQGVANLSSAVMGGIPATGTIARTATNIRAGALTPISGMLHSAFLLLFMIVLAPLAAYMPLAGLAAVLVIVAWNMSELKAFRNLLAGPPGEGLVLVATFLLTVLLDLTIAIEVGMVLAAFLFMHRMAKAVEIGTGTQLIDKDVDDFSAPRPDIIPLDKVPSDVEVFQINGPFFFGAATRLADVLQQMRHAPRVFILRMSRVPFIDTSGVHALQMFVDACAKRGTQVILSGTQPQVSEVITHMGLDVRTAKTFSQAIAMAEGLKPASG
jgi:sulfate permease, SulP family